MTEYWVSQGNKWCEFCKIFISSSAASIRNHEQGQRHKDSVQQRLTTMRENNAAKAKEERAAIQALEKIEEKAKKSYQKDVASFQQARDSNLQALGQEDGDGTAGFPGEWELDSSTGYYYNKSSACHYDPNSGFYYTDALGKWVTHEEALASVRASSGPVQKKVVLAKPLGLDVGSSASGNQGVASSKGVSGSPNPVKTFKGPAPSKLAVNKQTKKIAKPKVISSEEAAALKVREAARKRVEAREKSLLGLYKH